MYKHILVALDRSPSDAPLLTEARRLSAVAGAPLLLMHVADGWVARNYEPLQLAESDEMREDREYLEQCVQRCRADGLTVEAHLGLGEPGPELLRAAVEHGCDLIMMASHGHRWLGDLVRGSAIAHVRHHATVPLLIVPAPRA